VVKSQWKRKFFLLILIFCGIAVGKLDSELKAGIIKVSNNTYSIFSGEKEWAIWARMVFSDNDLISCELFGELI
jgi:hypothetical protein